jgi:ATP-binding cassette subfamily F protein 3
MISVDRLSVSFGGTFLFSDVSFLINSKDKVGLVGKNGAGKTRLIRFTKVNGVERNHANG